MQKITAEEIQDARQRMGLDFHNDPSFIQEMKEIEDIPLADIPATEELLANLELHYWAMEDASGKLVHLPPYLDDSFLEKALIEKSIFNNIEFLKIRRLLIRLGKFELFSSAMERFREIRLLKFTKSRSNNN